MNDKQWRIIVHFMRFTINALYRLLFKSIVGLPAFREFENERREFLKDIDEWPLTLKKED